MRPLFYYGFFFFFSFFLIQESSGENMIIMMNKLTKKKVNYECGYFVVIQFLKNCKSEMQIDFIHDQLRETVIEMTFYSQLM